MVKGGTGRGLTSVGVRSNMSSGSQAQLESTVNKGSLSQQVTSSENTRLKVNSVKIEKHSERNKHAKFYRNKCEIEKERSKLKTEKESLTEETGV